MNRTKYLKGHCHECGGHVEFPAEATGMTADCPHCGKPTELMLPPPQEESGLPRKTIIWTLIALVILVAGLAASLVALKRAKRLVAARSQKSTQAESLAVSNASVPKPAPDAATAADFHASRVILEKVPGSSLVYATGTLTNPRTTQRYGVKIELDLLDTAGKKLGVATDYQQVIEPAGKWQFKALVVDSRAASAKLSSIKEDQ